MYEEDPSLYFVYTKLLLDFTKKAKQKAFTLLHSIGIKIENNRFYFGSFSYPLSIIAFEHSTKLGFFNPHFFEIGLNKELMHHKEEIVERILKHELAHYLTYLHYGTHVSHHGKEFSSICKKYGWEAEKSAAIELPLSPNSSPQIKIAKLLNLANSKNIHEAELALTKAHTLIAKYGPPIEEEKDPYQMRRILKEKRTSQKLRSIADIVRIFGVYPVINHGLHTVYLEIFGQKECVEIAEYIGVVLYDVLETLWKKEISLSGMSAKNSFFRGIAQGFIEKHKSRSANTAALISIEKALHEALPLAYPRLAKSRTSGLHDQAAYAFGLAKGSSLQIDAALSTKKRNSNLLSHLT